MTKTLNFNTVCGIAAVPFEENFDTYPGATSQTSMVMPICWNKKYTGTSTAYGAGIYNSASYAVSGTNSLRLYNTCSTSTSTTYGDVYAVLPSMDAAINELMISFDAKPSTTASYNSFFEVGVITDVEATDYNSVFQPIGDAHIIPAGGQSFNILLSDYTGDNGNIAFRVTKTRPSVESRTGYYTYVYMDNLKVERIPTCFTPTALTVSEVTDHTAMVSWTDNYDQSSYALEYRADNENGWTPVTVDTTFYSLSNLLASTEYHVRVKAVCGTDDESEYTETVTFTTICEHGLETIIAGTGGTTYYLPVDNFYHYSYTQQIVDAEEMGNPGTISTIAFEYNYSTPMTKKTNVKIYMGMTDKTEFASTTDWVTTGLQQVYSGALNCSQGWNEFALSTPFAYTGGNVVVVIEDLSDAYDGTSYTFKQTTTSGYKGMYYHNDSNPFTGSNTASGRTTYRSNMKLIGCPEPLDLAITSVNTIPDACEVEGAVTFNVANYGYEPVSAFTAHYQLNEDTPVEEVFTLDVPLAMNESVTRTFSVQPNFAAGENIITVWIELEGDAVEANNIFTTDPIVTLEPATVPYIEDFSGVEINHGWNPIDANHDGITMNLNNDINYTFNDELDADDWMMSPCIEMTAGTYTILYDYKANSSLTEAFEVFYGNGNHIADMTNAVATHSFNNTTYETATNTITIDADGVYNFGFHATSLAGNLGFSIDNFKVYPVNNVVVTYAENGTVTPNGTIAVNYGENLTLNLVPDPMYHVAGVWVDDEQVVPEDGTGANFMLYTLENVTEPHTVFVDFKLEFHIFKTVENYNSNYADLGGAFVPAATDTTIDPNPFTVNMVADPHYFLAGLTLSPMVPDMPEDKFADVVPTGEGTYSYTIDTLVVANYYLNATFRRDTVAINYNVLTGKGYANDSQLLNAGDSYITWVDYSVNHDVDTTVTFAAGEDYHIVDVTVNGESKGRIDSYTFEDVTEAQNVDIKFGYMVDAFVSNYNTYEGITSVMGTITPDTQYVAEFDPMTVTGSVEEHFHLYQLLVNGENRIDEVNFSDDHHYYSFTIDSVKTNTTIEAVVKVDTFAITYNVIAGQGYAATSDLLVEGDSYSVIVNYADNYFSTITPATGYSIGNVVLDGESLYTASDYQFNYIETSHEFDITFVPNTYTITTNAYGNGTVSDGISFTYDPDNTVDYEFTATAAEGHHIVSVVINNEEMEITDPETFTYTIEDVADNYVINVHFAVNTYTMSSGATVGGTITPVGTQVVNYGAEVIYEINANEGWYIGQTVIDGVVTDYVQADNVVNLSVPFVNISDNHEVGVVFVKYRYAITVTTNGDTHGAINGQFEDILEYVEYGSNAAYTFDPDEYYQVADVIVDGVSMGAIPSYEFINVTEEHTVIVSFEAIVYVLTATSNIDACTISPATTSVQAGGSVNYTLTVANGYHLVNVIANGEEVVVNNNAFTIDNVQSDYTIFANFASDYVTVTVEQPEHATITPGTQTYAYGATPSYMIIPEVGYEIVNVTAGDAIVNVTYNNGIGTFTLDPVYTDITLTASTAKKQFTITVVPPVNGTISPAATQTVEYGDNVTFTIEANQDYVIGDVLVDGSSRGAINTFTFYNVTSDHTIEATFARYDGTGIANADLSSVKVYSFQNNVYIVNENGLAISNVDIFDIYGKQVYTGKVLSSPEVISLNVANGNYVVRLATESGVGVYKVVIVR